MRNFLYVSPSRDGWDNLGADEYFLDHLGPEDMLLYFYINDAAVIIGRGQNPWSECKLTEMAADGVQLVRRITGGGAVFHDAGNLNFSFIAGEARYDLQRQMNLILRAVRALGIPCEFTGRNDLVADGKKFSGNAFITRRGVRQHHGTLLIRADLNRLGNYLNVDPRKLQSKGAKSVRARVCNLSDFVPGLTVEDMLAALKDAYRAEYGDYCEWSADAPDRAAIKAYIDKQASDAWRLGQSPRFDQEIENRFAWGNVQLLLTLRHGAVDEITVYSDALDSELPDEIKRRLTGVAYDAQALRQTLKDDHNPQLNELAEYVYARVLQ